MASVGNHEHKDNFTEYVERFRSLTDFAGQQSKSNSSFFYSYDVGLIHYLHIDTEIFLFPNETANSPLPFSIEEQYQWIEEDLQRANEKREETPWVVMVGHKGWYMQNWGHFEKKDGEIDTNFTMFDQLACQYGVDLYLTGREKGKKKLENKRKKK